TTMSEPFTHIIAQTKQNIELLIAHRHITEADGQFILARLPNVEKDTAIAALTKQASRLNVSSRCVVPKCRALWDWSSEDPNDLGFHAGEIIEIISETNAEWWTGRNRAGKQGVFPATYKYSSPTPPQQYPSPPGVIQPYTPPPSRPPPQYGPPGGPPPHQYGPPPGPPQPYGPPPGPPQHYGPPPGPPQPYGPPPGPVYYPSGPPPNNKPPSQLAPAPQQGKLNNLGTTMAQSAASGVGFGAGASSGSADVVVTEDDL
ncbi:SH3 domain-containing protein, partial [Scleroderma citrinum]